MKYKKSKYHAKKVVIDGITFDSKKEGKRYKQLVEMQEKGEISNLQRQVKYLLIPAQREPNTIGPRGGIKKGKLLERECSYIADFVYDMNGSKVVEDTKGMRTTEYIIKRKLMLYVHKIKIKEV
ncbi:DUF1064 domain-containing protein [Lachnobacterium bovis]|uniref:DUF1064 domain-containing protein n=1 Tax=Lachnobacterium bovis TaxID=140626 RepID=UPI00047FC7EC|nr:DUF1064 domain-containing protein [Lachnobacterium bovis]SFG65344.1 Protein of unknown function [Lachnospiraceae bacterium C7]